MDVIPEDPKTMNAFVVAVFVVQIMTFIENLHTKLRFGTRISLREETTKYLLVVAGERDP